MLSAKGTAVITGITRIARTVRTGMSRLRFRRAELLRLTIEPDFFRFCIYTYIFLYIFGQGVV